MSGRRRLIVLLIVAVLAIAVIAYLFWPAGPITITDTLEDLRR